MTHWQDVNQGRSGKSRPAATYDPDILKARTSVPVSLRSLSMSAAERRAARLEKNERVAAEVARCAWCNEPAWRDVHGECPGQETDEGPPEDL